MFYFVNMNKNQKIFRYVFIGFTALMIALAIQMGMNTTAPWNKNKHKSTTIQKDSTLTDSIRKQTDK